MGAKIEELFKIVEEKAGTNGRMKFAQTSKIPRTKAALVKDDPELITYLKKIASQIIGTDINQFLN